MQVVAHGAGDDRVAGDAARKGGCRCPLSGESILEGRMGGEREGAYRNLGDGDDEFRFLSERRDV